MSQLQRRSIYKWSCTKEKLTNTIQAYFHQFPQNFIFCFGSNSKGYHGPAPAKLTLKHVGAKMGVASGRQGQSYKVVNMALK